MRRILLPALAMIVLVTGRVGGISEEVYFTRFSPTPYAYSTASAFKRPRQEVIRSQAAWRRFWKAAYPRDTASPPPVDFKQEMVIVAGLGRRLQGGGDILIDKIDQTKSGLLVQVKTQVPGKSCAASPTATSPFDLARLAKTKDKVRFKIHSEVRDCR